MFPPTMEPPSLATPATPHPGGGSRGVDPKASVPRLAVTDDGVEKSQGQTVSNVPSGY